MSDTTTLDALKTGYEALKDILGAADNRMPYTPDELTREFMAAYNTLYEVIIQIDPEYAE